MNVRRSALLAFGLLAGTAALMAAQGGGGAQQAQAPATPDPVQILVDRLDLEKYKATLKGLTQFGDRAKARSAIATPSRGSKRS
jgi:hypothetical protein